MKNSRQAIREGLANAGIITSDEYSAGRRYLTFDVVSADGRSVLNTCCTVFTKSQRDEAQTEYEISAKAYAIDPEHFINVECQPLSFTVNDCTDETCYALLTEKHGPLPEGSGMSTDMYIGLMHDIAEALDVLHREGHIHSCISPESIVVKNGVFCLTGFGEATAQCRLVDMFTAPEVMNGYLIGRSDLYSLGMVTRYLITGVNEIPQYVSDSGMIVRMKRRLLPLYSDDPITDRLYAVINKSSAFSPFDRYGSASELLRELEMISAGNADGYGSESVRIHCAG